MRFLIPGVVAAVLAGAPAVAQDAASSSATGSAGGVRPGAGGAGEVVVTGTRSPRTVREAPVRTDVIGRSVLEATAARNLADALDYLVGARSESNCQNCNTVEIQLLGLPGAYNQILLDGLPLVSGVAAVYGVEQVPALLVRQIEVVKGGGSALYGPGAVAGVVNVLPLRPERTGWRATLGYDRPDGEHAGIASVLGSLVLPDGRGFVNAYAQAELGPAVDLNGDGYSELARRRLATAGARGEWRPGPGTTVALDHQYTLERRRGGNLLDQPAFLSNIAEAIDSELHRAGVSVAQEVAPETRLVGVYAFAGLNRDSFYGGLGDVEADPAAPGFDPAAFAQAAGASRRQYGRTTDRLHFAEGRLEAMLGAHSVLAGVQYRHERVDDRGVDADGRELSVITQGAFSTLGAFVQDEWSLSSGLKLLLGARVDKSSELGRAVASPRVGLWASPVPELVLRANYSTGFRAPEVFSEDVHIEVLGADPIRVRNAPGLRAEKADSVALGFDWRPTWRDGAVTLDGQAYITSIRDTFFLGDIREDAGGLFRLRSNAGGSRVAGAELTIGYRLSDRLRATVGGAYLDALYDEPQVVYEDERRTLMTRRVLKSPERSGVGQVVWTPLPRFDAFAALRYIGRMDVLNNRLGEIRRTDDFLVVDLSATRHFPVGGDGREIDLTVGVRNVTDARQRDLEVGAARDSDYVYGPRSPRTLFVRLDAAL
ncbi:TonB-dependent receptor plug domain-containing protein [Sphingomonas lenta]|nr:TonB-dependent receptor [Sphingomonas lenta]